MSRAPATPAPSRKPSDGAGLVAGGLGGPGEELLEAGQEEVFSRTEVESGRIEHQSTAGGEAGAGREGTGRAGDEPPQGPAKP